MSLWDRPGQSDRPYACAKKRREEYRFVYVLDSSTHLSIYINRDESEVGAPKCVVRIVFIIF